MFSRLHTLPPRDTLRVTSSAFWCVEQRHSLDHKRAASFLQAEQYLLRARHLAFRNKPRSSWNVGQTPVKTVICSSKPSRWIDKYV